MTSQKSTVDIIAEQSARAREHRCDLATESRNTSGDTSVVQLAELTCYLLHKIGELEIEIHKLQHGEY